jgi:hypothetical protein
MDDCCGSGGYDETFSDRFARRMARRHDNRGLSRPSRAIVTFLTDRGIAGASVLEIGGGVGHIQVELLRRGAARATNLEISTNYENEAAKLSELSGTQERIDRRFLDIAQVPTRSSLPTSSSCIGWSAAIPTTNDFSPQPVPKPTGCSSSAILLATSSPRR